MAIRDYAGNAKPTALSGGISNTATSIGIDDATGWPTGGANGEFFATIARGESTEERILVQSRSGTTLTLASAAKRGVDGTAAATWPLGTSIEHTFSGIDADEANTHINDTTQDHHTQYLTNARHDVTARHAFGGALGTPGTPTAVVANQAAAQGAGTVAARDTHTHTGPVSGTPVAVGTALSAGSGTAIALANHVHELGIGSIDAANLFAAGVVDAAAIATGAVGSDEIAADAVGASELATGAVAAAGDIVDGILTFAKFAQIAPTSYTPTLGGEVGASNTKVAWYYRLSRVVVAVFDITLGAGGNIVGNITVGLPAGIPNNSTLRGFGAARARETGVSTWSGTGAIPISGTALTAIGTAGVDQWETNVPFNWQPGDTIVGVMIYFTD